jgi:hypothetical protein
MKEDEMAVWRRQWHGQPAVPIDLIRKIERETVRMRFGLLVLIVPLLIGVIAIVGAIAKPSFLSILMACGMWLFIFMSWLFGNKNNKGIWAPAADTTAAYVDLAITRCRSNLSSFRFANVFSPLLTVFVLAAVYEGLADKLQKAADYIPLAFSFLWTIAVISFVLIILARKRKQVQVELDYWLDLRRRLQGEQG